MKRLLIALIISVSCAWSIGQELVADSIAIDTATVVSDNMPLDENPNPLNLTAKDSLFLDYLEIFRSQQREPEYKLYPTKNMYNFLLLNTRTGQIDIVQWSTDRNNRFTYVLSHDIRRKSWQEDICGRYILQATENTYNFILLDQIDGYCWQVQWSFERDERFVVPIY